MNESDSELLDLIGGGSYSYAQQLVSRKLKQHPNRSFYHAVQNQLYYATGKKDEAIERNVTLMKKFPNDPATLKVLTQFFKNVGMLQEAESVYDNALKKYPSRDLAHEWFKESVKNHEVKNIQKSLMVIQKLDKGNRKNAFTAGFSCYLLANSTESTKEADLFKSLALRLTECQQPFENEQEIFLFAKILEASEKYDQAAEEIEKYMKKNVIGLDLKLVYLNCLDKLESWNSLYAYSKEQIFQEEFNDFDTWKLLIKSARHMNIPFEELNKMVSTYKDSRNTKLSSIELHIAYDKPLDDPVLSYFDSFVSKPCFYTDIHHYLSRGNFDYSLFDAKKDTSDFVPHTIGNLSKHINLQKLNLRKGAQDEKFIEANLKIYDNFSELIKTKQEFDPFPGNELLLMNGVSDLTRENNSITKFQNYLILSKALATDKNNSLLMLWTLMYNSHFGFSDLTLNSYKRLKIKMIQHDTLGHYLTLVPSTNNLNEMVNIYRFYLTVDDEIQESLLDGFENTIFSRLESFVNFGKKITFSISRYLLILNIIRSCKIIKNHQYLGYFIDAIKSIKFSILNESLTLYDNRDLKTLWNFGTFEEYQFFETTNRKTEYVLLNIVKNLLVYASDDKKDTTKLLKLFNKYFSNASLVKDQISKVESWVYKIYLNVFKVIKTPEVKDLEASKNFLNKNLKLSKVQNILSDNLISGTFNDDLAALIELTKDLSVVAKSNKSIMVLNSQLAKDLKEFDFRKLQSKRLSDIQSSLRFRDNFVDKDFLDESFDIYRNSILQSSKVVDYI